MVGNKQEMLVACIREHSKRLQAPADLPEPRDRDTLERALVAFGTQLLRETTDSGVIAVFGWRSPKRYARPRSPARCIPSGARPAAPP